MTSATMVSILVTSKTKLHAHSKSVRERLKKKLFWLSYPLDDVCYDETIHRFKHRYFSIIPFSYTAPAHQIGYDHYEGGNDENNHNHQAD